MARIETYELDAEDPNDPERHQDPDDYYDAHKDDQ